MIEQRSSNTEGSKHHTLIEHPDLSTAILSALEFAEQMKNGNFKNGGINIDKDHLVVKIEDKEFNWFKSLL